MYSEGLRTRRSTKLNKSRLAEMLSDPFYYGTLRWQGSSYQGKHTPLITKALFDAVQTILRKKCNPKYRTHFPLFKGLFTCPQCTGTITWEKQKGHWYGHCSYYHDCSVRKYMREERVTEQLASFLNIFSEKDARLLECIKKAIKESHQDEIEYHASIKTDLRKRYDAIEQRLDRLYDDKIDEKIDQEFYDRKFAQYVAEKSEIINSLQQHDTANTKYFEIGMSLADLAFRAQKILLNPSITPERKRKLFQYAFSALFLKGDKVRVDYSQGFKIILERASAYHAIFEPHKNLPDKQESTRKGVDSRLVRARPDLNRRSSP